MDIWDRRRKNLAALIAFKGFKPAQVAQKSGVSVNTVGKFLRGETQSMRQVTLDKICATLGIPSADILDSENPLSRTRHQLLALVKDMSDEEVSRTLDLINEHDIGSSEPSRSSNKSEA